MLKASSPRSKHRDRVGLAAINTETVLSLHDDAPAGTLATGRDGIVRYRAEIYQAPGMCRSNCRSRLDRQRYVSERMRTPPARLLPQLSPKSSPADQACKDGPTEGM